MERFETPGFKAEDPQTGKAYARSESATKALLADGTRNLISCEVLEKAIGNGMVAMVDAMRDGGAVTATIDNVKVDDVFVKYMDLTLSSQKLLCPDISKLRTLVRRMDYPALWPWSFTA